MRKRGLVLGKFMPFHQGHINLINFAKEMVDDVVVLVDNHESYIIDLATRISLIKNSVPHIEVLGIEETTPQEPEDHPDFWNEWKRIIQQYSNGDIDYIIGSQNYIKDLAKVLNIKFIMYDKDRSQLPVSATMIRDNPYKYWGLLSPQSRCLYSKKVCIVGAESTGKSTLTKVLATQFKTNFVSEYARILIEENEGKIEKEDYDLILRGQFAQFNILNPYCNKIIFIDTDAITTSVWHEIMYGEEIDVTEYVKKQQFDLYLVTIPHTEWVSDIVRFHPDQKQREKFQELLIKKLEKHNVNYSVLTGQSYSERTEDAINIINQKYKKQIGT